jgi:hypothetical protein
MQGKSQELLTAGASLLADTLVRVGRVQLRAIGTSMWPTIRSGDVLEVQRCAANELRVGDIVLVKGLGGIRVHRLLRRGTEVDCLGIVTRGDSHWRADESVAESNVLGRVVRVSRTSTPTSTVSISTHCTRLQRARGLAESELHRTASVLRRLARFTLLRVLTIVAR